MNEIKDRNRPVIFSAHGVPKAVPAEATNYKMEYIDATCPLVSKVHREAENLKKAGYHILLVGHLNHPEVIGTMGQLPNGSIDLIESVKDVEKYAPKEEKQIAQTILGKKKDEFAGLIAQTPSLVPGGIIIDKIEYKKEDYAIYHGNALSDLDLSTFLERLKKNIGRSELTTMNKAVITVSEGNNAIENISDDSEFEGSSDQISNNTIKAKTFTIKIDLSDT